MSDLDAVWDRLLSLGVHEQTLQIVTSINGYTQETLEAVLYAYTGYRSFDQLEGEPPEPENRNTNYGSPRKAGPFQGR